MEKERRLAWKHREGFNRKYTLLSKLRDRSAFHDGYNGMALQTIDFLKNSLEFRVILEESKGCVSVIWWNQS